MPYCAVPNCRNGTGKGNIKQAGISYHRFPNDNSLAQAWWLNIKRGGVLTGVKDPRVCSTHFKDDDFKRNLMHELLNPGSIPPIKKDILPTAIPSLNIPSSHPSRYGHNSYMLG